MCTISNKCSSVVFSLNEPFFQPCFLNLAGQIFAPNEDTRWSRLVGEAMNGECLFIFSFHLTLDPQSALSAVTEGENDLNTPDYSGM